MHQVGLPLLTLDIRKTCFKAFLHRIRLELPWSYCLSELPADDQDVSGRQLSGDLHVTPLGRIDLYRFAAYCYCQTPTPWSLAWARLRDGTLGELHQRLRHEANMRVISTPLIRLV